MDSDIRSAGSEDPSLQRACDQCRIRKIRCDKTSPCSNCRIAMRTCSSIGVSQKPREQKNRVLISHQYERKIDLIEERLSGIEEALRKLAANTSSYEAGGRADYVPPLAQHSMNHTPSQTQESEAESDPGFEGELSLTAHTAFARDFLENAVQRTSLNELPSNMEAALSTLRQLMSMQDRSKSSMGEQRLRFGQNMPPGGLSEMPMPPMNTVVSLLRQQKVSPPGFLKLVCSFIEYASLADLCRKIYFCTDTFSHSTFVIVNGALYYLFTEHLFVAKDVTVRSEFNQYLRMCQVNLETAMSSFPLMLSAKMDNIQALLMATVYCIDIGKPSMAWRFASMALNLCQTLGYHRMPKPTGEKTGGKDVRMLLFWNSYILEKDLALWTGRSSAIQDWDITTARNIDNTQIEDPFGSILTSWVREASLQQKIYEWLYSPNALARPVKDRIERVRHLEAEQKKIMAEASQGREHALFGLKAINASGFVDLYLKGDELCSHSTLVLIYRALPTPEGSQSHFSSECVETARFAMQLHHECLQAIADEGQQVQCAYIHWAILITPFAPFFVLFCYVIETSSREDLKLLFSFVDSLRPACEVSEAVRKLRQLCHALYNVALTYLEAKSQHTAESVPISQEFDMYLNALGFAPSQHFVSQCSPAGSNPPSNQAEVEADQLGNWFLSNQQMMGLLEEDMPEFDQGGWMG